MEAELYFSAYDALHQTDLTCTAGDDTFLDDSVYHEYHFSSRNAGKHVDIKVNVGIYYGNNAAKCGRSDGVRRLLTTSCVDSGIGGTISTHSELSAFCLSPSADLPPNPPKSFLGPFMNYRQQQSNASTPGSFDDDVVSFLDLPIAPREDTVADEVFVSKFVLSEQVFRQEWYLERQPFLESAVLDTVPKIKAAMIAEEWEDVVVRANAELTRLMHLISVLDRYPLVSDSRPLLLLNTLVAFVPEELRWCCLRMYRHKYSPYVRLQAVRRCELPYVMQCGALSSWPICVVDVDRATVCMSPPYSRHRVLKQRADAQRISIILDSSFRCKPVTL
ncbi:hypothetical protein TELCIR_16383 [Teladorsagia circumcincta]|uniref:Uncharacterized protein n=1 Tax=Teladorsagia circumcincta TaxID=45464 RepID=A0A2G9TVR8_TELCI|nr:hypothetical protein TELCIR_16383 [Teladorsagia circumcincta]